MYAHTGVNKRIECPNITYHTHFQEFATEESQRYKVILCLHSLCCLGVVYMGVHHACE